MFLYDRCRLPHYQALASEIPRSDINFILIEQKGQEKEGSSQNNIVLPLNKHIAKWLEGHNY